MKISNKSLFYRFLRTNIISCDDYIPTNLCPFMRKVLGTVLVNILLFSMIAFMGICAIAPIVAFIIPYDLWGEMWPVFIIVGCIFYAVNIFIAAGTGIKYLTRRYQVADRVFTTLEESSPLQIIGHWMRATHDKVCPPIEFVD